jgi:hypothetical protein
LASGGMISFAGPASAGVHTPIFARSSRKARGVAAMPPQQSRQWPAQSDMVVTTGC